VEQKIQMFIQFAVKTFGPILLQGGLGGGGGAAGSTNSQKADDDFDDFDDSAENDVDENKSKVSISLPTFAPDAPAVRVDVPVAAPSTSVDAPARIDLFDSFDDDKSSSTQASSSQTSTLSLR
jgi:hypothetical protein